MAQIERKGQQLGSIRVEEPKPKATKAAAKPEPAAASLPPAEPAPPVKEK